MPCWGRSTIKVCTCPFLQLKSHVALVLAEQWITENAHELKKSLRMVPVNLRNEIKRLARTIVLCSWGLSPGLGEQIQDIIAYRRALVEALIQTYDHVDSPMAVGFLFFLLLNCVDLRRPSPSDMQRLRRWFKQSLGSSAAIFPKTTMRSTSTISSRSR